MYSKVLQVLESSAYSTQEISTAFGQKSISGQLYSVINKLRENGLIEWTIPSKPKSSKQKYRVTQKGKAFYQLVKEGKS
ncbi:hypothetical protein R9C00_04760 [Flammeovirgaceae bacterium SG7u.111]|nr:hypothetical protein [Flammeovirgaceae bacterium SG7u.132]WPO36754.1 hypothetical protein R9C00_04760 [Flammeovirgaceae bacterium SG7u.111]